VKNSNVFFMDKDMTLVLIGWQAKWCNLSGFVPHTTVKT
jgi:hypothetical protein